MRNNVFISHIHEDDARLRALKDLVGRQGRTFADSSINSDRPNKATSEGYIKSGILADRIRRSGVVIVLVSPQTRHSTWVDWEIRYANRLGKPIVGIWDRGASGCDVPDALTMFGRAVVGWNTQQILDAIDGKIDCWQDPDGTTIPPRKINRHCGR